MTNEKLNEWLARELFGLDADRVRRWQEQERVYAKMQGGLSRAVEREKFERLRREGCRPVDDYAGTYNGMGLVIEKMREKGYDMELTAGEAGFACAFATEHQAFEHLDHVESDSAPLAVALAAKAALEGGK